MAKCEWCGNNFNRQEAEYEFDSETFGLSYGNIRKCLCGTCSVDVIKDEVDGIYFESCEDCGTEFDLIEEQGKFSSNFSWESGAGLRDYWKDKILCCDCAIKIAENE